eukprot:gnl/TRDRNA2_/TRDRNA2_147044_c1_seq1.p1 gnl/TRDRNA2_/TRDRNA2_147044_c1~~gnl/TRDRNA2_/TRDRNA2_147044_c1_seq1.p1  ORF type:complete len:297 (-),score=32.94 gnl/TRDRNA2_/TRDRNA2_147044_c1_seq1:106-939(-)
MPEADDTGIGLSATNSLAGTKCENCARPRTSFGVGSVYCHACSGIDDRPLRESILWPVLERRRLRREVFADQLQKEEGKKSETSAAHSVIEPGEEGQGRSRRPSVQGRSRRPSVASIGGDSNPSRSRRPSVTSTSGDKRDGRKDRGPSKDLTKGQGSNHDAAGGGDDDVTDRGQLDSAEDVMRRSEGGGTTPRKSSKDATDIHPNSSKEVIVPPSADHEMESNGSPGGTDKSQRKHGKLTKELTSRKTGFFAPSLLPDPDERSMPSKSRPTLVSDGS